MCFILLRARTKATSEMGLLREVGPQGGGMKARPPPVLRTVGGESRKFTEDLRLGQKIRNVLRCKLRMNGP